MRRPVVYAALFLYVVGLCLPMYGLKQDIKEIRADVEDIKAAYEIMIENAYNLDSRLSVLDEFQHSNAVVYVIR